MGAAIAGASILGESSTDAAGSGRLSGVFESSMLAVSLICQTISSAEKKLYHLYCRSETTFVPGVQGVVPKVPVNLDRMMQ